MDKLVPIIILKNTSLLNQQLQQAMASLIEDALSAYSIEANNYFIPAREPDKPIPNLSKGSPFQKHEKCTTSFIANGQYIVNIYFDLPPSTQSIAEISFDLRLNIATLKLKVLRQGKLLKISSKRKADIFCRLFQKYNLHLNHENVLFAINASNGVVTVRYNLIYYFSHFSSHFLKGLYESTNRIVNIINEQMIFLIECVNQTFEWEIYAKDGRYLEKIVAEANETLKIRELIALSYISFEDSSENGQHKYTRNKELINFLNHRQNMVSPALKKQSFAGPEMNLFCYFMEPNYFSTHPLSLHTLENDFTNQFSSLFYKFQPKKMANGDNPYLFNTILIKNEEKVELRDVGCEGGFSKLQITDLEITYTESQNIVSEHPRASSKNHRNSSSQEKTTPCENTCYIPKTIAIKICKNDVDYDKIRHEKIIVQNFRTTASPFILKYYNCTQKAFKYRHYLLMDYLGPQLTLSEYNELHKLAFSLHSKMHVFIHLTNALTFLEKQQVVHMDLSSHNVMIYRDLLIKLIDFGQAYHPYLDTDRSIKYNPGYTLPYCPPETFNRIKKFTSKSDIFSLGIILYRTIFGDFPFNVTSELRDSFIAKSYLQKLFIAPERLSEYGYQTQLLLLLQLITRCLSPEESRRPTPYWAYVILNKIFLTFK